ncbi:MAG: MFS transporter [Bacteroidota bacterium]|nr:MFS transporter [Bacteroidota bacterium]
MSIFDRSSLEIFKIKQYRYFILARFFLTLGIQLQMSTINLQVYYEFTKEEFILGMIGLAEAVPFIIASFFSGHYADLLNRKKIILGGIFMLLLGAIALYVNSAPFVTVLRSFGLPALFIIVMVFGVVRSFLAASVQPFMTSFVPRHLYTQSSTWNSTAWHIGAILGPVIAGLIYAFRGQLHADWCYLLNIALYVLAFVFIAITSYKQTFVPENTESIVQSMKVGLNFVFKNKMVLSALSLDLFAVLFGGAVVLIPAFTDKILHLGPQAYGLLRTSPAIGAVFMALIMTVKPPGKKAGVALLWSVVAFGLFTIGFAYSTNYWWAFAMLAFAGAFDNISVVIRHSILQLLTPDNMRGRVSAVNSIFIGSSNEIGAFESGVAAKFLGLVPSIAFGGVMTILVVLGIHKANPKLKDLDLTKDP